MGGAGVGWVVGDDRALAGIFGVGVCAGVFTVGEGFGDGSGVATGFDPEFEVRAEAGPVLLARFELTLRDVAADDRSAAFLLADAGGTLGPLAFEFRFEFPLLIGRGTSRLAFDPIAELPPATVNTTSSRFECCSTLAVAPGWR